MSGTVDDGDSDRFPQVPLTPRDVIADPRKFSAYVLVPGHRSGKAGIFVNSLGYRPYSDEDARELVTTYTAQARAKVATGDYILRKTNRYGRLLAIEIDIKGRSLISIWLLAPDGILSLVTPFSGFWRRSRRRGQGGPS